MEKIEKIKEKYQVVCDEGTFEFQDLKSAENKVRNIHKAEGFGYLVKTEFDKNGKKIKETFVG
jgi:hypothetical protein